MAGDAEALRMAAEIVDKFSGPLKEMQRQLRAFSEYGQKAHKEGVSGAKAHEESIHKLRDAFRQTTDIAKGGFEPAIESIGMTAVTTGIGLGTVATAIGGVVAAAVGFAGTASRLHNLSVASGLAVNDLRALLDLGPRIGLSADQMGEGVQNFAEHMGRLSGSPGAVAKELGALERHRDPVREGVPRQPPRPVAHGSDREGCSHDRADGRRQAAGPYVRTPWLAERTGERVHRGG
jgi:hypothetical protein